jgi:DNA invertase Pin-like site-specific DNA recombinase
MKVIEYYRVSTQKQGFSGLGLEAQETTVRNYINSIGATSIAVFKEIESGGNKDRISVNSQPDIATLLRKRPTLQQAIDLAMIENATIVVKEASRLTRYSLLMNHLIASNVKFIAAMNPNDDALMLRIKTALNEEELTKISERTIAALQARKNRGLPLGTLKNLTVEGMAKGRAVHSKRARESTTAIQVIDIIREKLGKMTFVQIAEHLNSKRYRTPRGKKFLPGTVNMYVRRIKAEQEIN